MTQPAPRLSSYIATRLAPSQGALGLGSAARECGLLRPRPTVAKTEGEAARPLLTRPLRTGTNGRVPRVLYPRTRTQGPSRLALSNQVRGRRPAKGISGPP